MKLYVVTHTLSRTEGQARVNGEIVAALAGRGATVDVISAAIDPELATVPGVRWQRVGLPKALPTILLKDQWFGLAAGRILRRLPKADVLQRNGAIVHGASCDVNVANFVHGDWIRSPYHPARSGGTLNAVYQSAFTRLNAVWERRAFGRAKRVVAVSESVRHALIQHAGVDPAVIVVIPPGVDSNQFRPLRPNEPNHLKAELKLEKSSFIVMFTGDIRSNRKNLDLVLQSLAQLPASVHVAVVGDEARSPYPAMAASLGVGDRVHFLGRRTTDLPALMRGADVFAFPSHYDPFGLVTTEAMASGVPVITAPTAGSSALIDHGVDGFVLPAATDLDGFVRTVRDLYADPARRAAIAQAARNTAEQHSWKAMADQYERLYHDVIARRSTSVFERATPA